MKDAAEQAFSFATFINEMSFSYWNINRRGAFDNPAIDPRASVSAIENAKEEKERYIGLVFP